MITLSVVPTRAQFQPGASVGLVVEAAGEPGLAVELSGEVTAGAPAPSGAPLARFFGEVRIGEDGKGSRTWEIAVPAPPHGEARGFAVAVRGADAAATTAFDVAAHWSMAPRYGFFADFAPDEDPAVTRERADKMTALHLNVVQFYDWMYSHHTLVPPADEFVDPLGRRLSLDVVRRKVEAAHERGMAAIGYGALYGAEAAFADDHPDWLLYDGRHEPLRLAELFYLQDIREVSPWRRWIIDQFVDAVTRVGFDGIHIDQYGYPKRSLSRVTGRWETVELGDEFMGFVREACAAITAARPHGGSIFNLVNAWPLAALPELEGDAATYVEVWDPHSTYRDLYDLVTRARTLRPDKHVILAAYLRAFHPADGRKPGAMTAFRLAQAAIGSAGGFHLIAGEGSGLLTEAYYPSYGSLSDEDFETVRRYADFAVRNTAGLHGGGDDVAWTQVGSTNDVVLLEHEALAGPRRGLIDTGERYGAGAVRDTVWCVQRDRSAVSTLSLVNLLGLATDHWNSAHEDGPTALRDVQLRVMVVGDIAGVWWDTPDDAVGVSRPLDYRVTDDGERRYLEFVVPTLDVWSLVWWERA